jgi:hypothetical protein
MGKEKMKRGRKIVGGRTMDGRTRKSEKAKGVRIEIRKCS